MLAAAIVLRVQSMPPRFDEMRLHHWLYHEQMTKLARALLRDKEIDMLILRKSAVEARSSKRISIQLTQQQESHYRDLMEQSGIDILFRAQDSLVWDVGLGRRFGRDFDGGLVYSEESKDAIPICNSQYKFHDAGECLVELGDVWALYYSWMTLPIPGAS